MHIYTSSFFKFRNKANFYSFLGASAGTGAPRNTQKIGTQCGCKYGYKNHESLVTLIKKTTKLPGLKRVLSIFPWIKMIFWIF